MVPLYSLTSQAYGSAFAPAQWVQQEGLKVLERLARYQVVIVQDLIQYNFAGLHAMVSAGTPVQYFARQGELNLGLVRTVTADTQKFLKESSDVAQQFVEVVKHSTEDFAGSAERAANTSLKKATEAAEEFTRQVMRQTEEEEFMKSASRGGNNSEEHRETEERAATPSGRRAPRTSTQGTRRSKHSRREHH